MPALHACPELETLNRSLRTLPTSNWGRPWKAGFPRDPGVPETKKGRDDVSEPDPGVRSVRARGARAACAAFARGPQ